MFKTSIHLDMIHNEHSRDSIAYLYNLSMDDPVVDIFLSSCQGNLDKYLQNFNVMLIASGVDPRVVEMIVHRTITTINNKAHKGENLSSGDFSDLIVLIPNPHH